MKIIALHKYSTRYIQAEVPEADVQAFANEALATFRREVDREIPEEAIVVIKLEGNPNVLACTTLDLINNPPENRPVTITTHN